MRSKLDSHPVVGGTSLTCLTFKDNVHQELARYDFLCANYQELGILYLEFKLPLSISPSTMPRHLGLRYRFHLLRRVASQRITAMHFDPAPRITELTYEPLLDLSRQKGMQSRFFTRQYGWKISCVCATTCLRCPPAIYTADFVHDETRSDAVRCDCLFERTYSASRLIKALLNFATLVRHKWASWWRITLSRSSISSCDSRI